jgi:hypothetical protein
MLLIILLLYFLSLTRLKAKWPPNATIAYEVSLYKVKSPFHYVCNRKLGRLYFAVLLTAPSGSLT